MPINLNNQADGSLRVHTTWRAPCWKRLIRGRCSPGTQAEVFPSHLLPEPTGWRCGDWNCNFYCCAMAPSLKEQKDNGRRMQLETTTEIRETGKRLCLSYNGAFRWSALDNVKLIFTTTRDSNLLFKNRKRQAHAKLRFSGQNPQQVSNNHAEHIPVSIKTSTTPYSCVPPFTSIWNWVWIFWKQ